VKINGNVADLLLAQLAEWGVRRIYGVCGDAIFPLLDAFSRHSAPTFIATAHEAGASFAASYEAAVTGNLAVCTATSGPGAVNLLAGLADAHMENRPVLAITGQVETRKMGCGTVQFFDQQSVYRNFASSTSFLLDPGAVPDALLTAVRQALLSSSVVHLSIPKDVLLAPVSAETLPAAVLEVSGSPVVCGGIDPVLAAVRPAQRPLVVMGREARPAKDLVLLLAGRLGAGLILAQEAKGAIPDDHELNLGGIGEAFLPPLLREADRIILIGSAPFEQQYFPPGAGLVHLGDRPQRLHRALAASVTGDLRTILKTLCDQLPDHAVNQEWLDRVKAQAGSRPKPEDIPARPGPMHPLRLMMELDRVMPHDAVICLDVGEFIHWFDRGFCGRGQDILLSGKWEAIGAGLPAALGVKLACPQRTVVAIVGDGGLLMSMAELVSCVRHRAAVVASRARARRADANRPAALIRAWLPAL